MPIIQIIHYSLYLSLSSPLSSPLSFSLSLSLPLYHGFHCLCLCLCHCLCLCLISPISKEKMAELLLLATDPTSQMFIVIFYVFVFVIVFVFFFVFVLSVPFLRRKWLSYCCWPRTPCRCHCSSLSMSSSLSFSLSSSYHWPVINPNSKEKMAELLLLATDPTSQMFISSKYFTLRLLDCIRFEIDVILPCMLSSIILWHLTCSSNKIISDK